MRQDSDTENNSRERPKLSLRKKTSPAGEQGAAADPTISKDAETSKRPPLKINKNTEESTAPAAASAPQAASQTAPSSPTADPSSSAPTAEEASSQPKKLGLKKHSAPADANAQTPPPATEQNKPGPHPSQPPTPPSTASEAETKTDKVPPFPPSTTAGKATIPSSKPAPSTPPDVPERTPGKPPPIPISPPATGAVPPAMAADTSSATAATPPPLPPKDLMTEDLEKLGKGEKKGGHMAKAMGAFLVVAFFLAGAVILLVLGVKTFLSSDAANDPQITATEPPIASASESATPALSMPDEILQPAVSQSPETPVAEPSAEVQEVNTTIKYEPTPKPKLRRARPSIEVARWVDNMHPSGVSSRRIFIDGTMFTLGSVVNDFPKIVWVDVDTQLGVLTFEDENGVRYEKDF